MSSFLDFCEYIVDKASSENNGDLWKLIFIDFYKKMIKPFAQEFNYEIPDKLKDYIEITQGNIETDTETDDDNESNKTYDENTSDEDY